MRVLLPTMRDPGQIGGTSTHMAMLVKGLRELGCEAEALYLGGCLPSVLRKGLLIWPAGALNRVRTGWGMMYAAETRARVLARVTRREVSKGQLWEVLNAQEVYSVPYLRQVADDHGLPLVLTLHGYPLYESVSEGYTAKSRMGRHYLMRAEMRALRLADAVVTVDSRLYRHVLGLVPERAESVFTMMNFIDTEAFAPPSDPAEDQRQKQRAREAWGVPQHKIVLFCPRRLVKKNGVIYPALALAAMKPEQRERFLLLHAGEGGERGEIERIVQENRLAAEVRLLGGQGREAIRELYRLADIVLVPSVHSENVEEATSLSALEAMASGRPLIAGAVGGLAEMIVDGQTGLLVEITPENLAAAILRLAAAPELGARLAAAARRYVVENHSHRRAAAAYLDIYRYALNRVRRAGQERDRAAASEGRRVPSAPAAATVAAAATAGPTAPPAPIAGATATCAGLQRPWPSVSVLGFPLDIVTLEEAAQWLINQALDEAAPTGNKAAWSADREGATAGAGGPFVTAATTRPAGTAGAPASVTDWAVNEATSSERSAKRAVIAISFNPEIVMRAREDPAAAQVLREADLCYPDGVGAVWAAARQGAMRRVAAGTVLTSEGPVTRWRRVEPERVPGIELAERVLELAAERELAVFFLGAAPGVAEEAAARQVQRLPQLKVVGTHHGYFSLEEETTVVEKVRATGAQVLLVAMGAPRQELFIYRHRESMGVRLAMGVGGSFDVWAGRVKRAPGWVQAAKMEWLYRLLTNPKRLRRQLALPRYAWQVLRWCPEDYGPGRGGHGDALAQKNALERSAPCAT